MRCLIIFAAAAALPLSAGAQDPAGPTLRDLDLRSGSPERPDGEEAAPPPRSAAPSELDALSRNADDPFAGVIDQVERKPVSVTLRALDKITARYTDIEIPMNETAHFGTLELLPRYCDKRPPEEFPETTVFLEVFDVDTADEAGDLKVDPALLKRDAVEGEPEALPASSVEEIEDIRTEFPEFGSVARAGAEEDAPVEAAPLPSEPLPARPAPEVLNGPQPEGENIFRGWMFASSPALNALEHPVYDVWVIDCKTRAVDSAGSE